MGEELKNNFYVFSENEILLMIKSLFKTGKIDEEKHHFQNAAANYILAYRLFEFVKNYSFENILIKQECLAGFSRCNEKLCILYKEIDKKVC